ncbi:MAG: ATP-binding protein [Pseudomonadales bacterium]|nr:ATP-binding protein [Pseudomonadales bacterium]
MERSTFSEQASTIGRIGFRLTIAAFILIIPLSTVLYLYINQLVQQQEQAELDTQSAQLLSALNLLNWYKIREFYADEGISRALNPEIEARAKSQAAHILKAQLHHLSAKWEALENINTQPNQGELNQFMAYQNASAELIQEIIDSTSLAGHQKREIRISARLISQDIPSMMQRLFLLSETTIQLTTQSGLNIKNAVGGLLAESQSLALHHNRLVDQFLDPNSQSPQLHVENKQLYTEIDRFLEKKKQLAFMGILGQETQWDLDFEEDIAHLRQHTYNELKNIIEYNSQLSQSIQQQLKATLNRIKRSRDITLVTVLILVIAALFLGYYIIKSIRFSQEYLEKQNDTLEAIIGERTDALQKEKQFAEALNSELQSKTLLANKLTEKAESANNAKTLFLASMSHEIRTPLNALIGGTNLLKKSKLNPDQSAMLSLIHTSANTLLDLVSDVLDFSKIEANELKLEHIEFDLELVVSNLLRIFSVKAKEKGILLDWEFDGDCCGSWQGDPTRIKQIIMNLVSNAIKFTEKGHVRCRIFTARNLIIEIEDTGIGMPEKSTEGLFNPFTQSDASITRKFGGSGLGLSITKRLTELMGGTITVHSQINQGSTFQVSLPIAKHTDQYLSLAKTKILIAGDCSELTSRLKNCGATLACCWQPDEIKDLINTFNPDVIITASWGEQAHAIGNEIEHTPIPTLDIYRYTEAAAKRPSHCDNESYYATSFIIVNKILRLTGQPFDATLFTDDTLSPRANQYSGNVLLVEDVEFNRVIAKEFLTDLGLSITEAHNGAEAVELYLKGDFDLILMDLHMPVLDGFKAALSIRDREQMAGKPPVPIIAMTADVTKDAHEKIALNKMDGYLSKPFEEEELLQILNQYLICYPVETAPMTLETPDNNPQGPAELSAQVFDFAALSRRLKHRMDRIQFLIDSFQGNLGELITAIDTAMENNNPKDLMLHAHSLKGSAANLGAMRISQIAADIESTAKSGSDINSIPNKIQQLKQEQAPFIQAANAAIAQAKAQQG